MADIMCSLERERQGHTDVLIANTMQREGGILSTNHLEAGRRRCEWW